jgi:cell division protein FtsB
MRFFACALALFLVLLQYRIWFSDEGLHEVWRLKSSIATQTSENVELLARNQQLAAEVTDLKHGMIAIEERARSELGMVGRNETFYQVVAPSTLGPLPPATVTSARVN